ncbi:integrase, partial [Acinetobacter baumannii]
MYFYYFLFFPIISVITITPRLRHKIMASFRQRNNTWRAEIS